MYNRTRIAMQAKISSFFDFFLQPLSGNKKADPKAGFSIA